jgi:SAM-dependent MidA family methyltransferase
MHSFCYLLSTTPNAIALFCDYGEDRAFGDSFRGIKKQKILKRDEILANTGKCDLTSYVNFKALRRVIYQYPNLKFGGLMTQGNFLYYLHAKTRAEELKKSDPKLKAGIDSIVKRLMDLNEMGSTYKFLFVHKKNIPQCFPFLDDILEELKAPL